MLLLIVYVLIALGFSFLCSIAEAVILSVSSAYISVLEKEGKLEPYYHAVSRPNIAEEEAIYRASKMVELTGSRIYIVHLSSKEGLWIVKEARDRGVNIYAETCPQYLLLDDSRYKEPRWNGAKYVMSPPLRTGVSASTRCVCGIGHSRTASSIGLRRKVILPTTPTRSIPTPPPHATPSNTSAASSPRHRCSRCRACTGGPSRC